MSTRVFITGAFKTATSSMLAAMNMHPDFYMLFELYDTPKMRPRFLEFYPDAAFINKNLNREELYVETEKFIAKKGYNYKYFGDKIATSDKTMNYQMLQELDKLGDYIIFMIRDLQYWTAKMVRMPKHIKYFSPTCNIAEMVFKYIAYFLNSYKISCIHIKTEELISNKLDWVNKISNYIAFF